MASLLFPFPFLAADFLPFFAADPAASAAAAGAFPPPSLDGRVVAEEEASPAGSRVAEEVALRGDFWRINYIM